MLLGTDEHRSIEQNPESRNRPSKIRPTNFDKYVKEIQWRQDSYVNKWHQINHISTSYKEELQPKVYMLHKINSKRSTQNGSQICA